MRQQLGQQGVDVPNADLSASDLEQVLQLTADDERTDEEQRILEGIAALGTKDAKQVMTARTDMESVSSRSSGNNCAPRSSNRAIPASPSTAVHRTKSSASCTSRTCFPT